MLPDQTGLRLAPGTADGPDGLEAVLVRLAEAVDRQAAGFTELAAALRGVPTPATADPDELIDGHEHRRLLSVSESTFERRRAAGELLPPIQIGSGKKLLWRRGDVLAWLRQGCPAPRGRKGR